MPPKKIVKEEEEEVVVGGGGDNNNSFEGNVFFIIGEAKDEKGKALTKTELAKLKKDIEEEGGKLFTRITAKVNWLIVGTPKDTADQTRAKKISDEKSVENFVTLEAVRNALSSGSAFTDADKKAGEEAFQKAFLTDSVEPPTKKIKEEEDEEEEKEEKEKEEEEEKEEGKKIVVKGRAAVDEYVPGGDGMMVYQEPDVIWDCMLNQTNIAGNNNKFYKIQLLVKEGTTQYYIWNRWGRVGERGQNKLMPMSGLPYAKADFEKKFREKTKNNWANRANFVSHPGKYTLLEIDYNPDEDSDGEKKKKEEEEDNNNNEEEEAEEKKEAESKLDKRVQDLIKLIFDMKMMESVLTSEFEFDAKKQPLGKLTKKQIKDGYLVLQEIEKAFKRSAGATEIMELSSRFYTLIPHCFGRMRPPSINTSELLKKKMKMLESLADIEVAVKLIKDSAKKDKDAEEQLALVDINYRKLNAELTPLEKDDSEYKLIETYVANTHPRNTPKIKSIFRLKRAGEHERYVPKMPLGNRKLLWHGSRLTNVK